VGLYGVYGDEEAFSYLPVRELTVEAAQHGELPAGLLSLTWLIGLYALIFGIAFIVLGFRVRGHGTSSRVT
jgi:hypothetical protein